MCECKRSTYFLPVIFFSLPVNFRHEADALKLDDRKRQYSRF